MKVVLVRPPFYALFGVKSPKMKTYPLNLLCLATYVRDQRSHAVTIVDGETLEVAGSPPLNDESDPSVAMHEGIRKMLEIMTDPDAPVWLELERRILNENPEIVGITCNSGNMDTVKLLVKRLKPSRVPIILGGSHPTALPEQSIRYCDADMVVMGEGELTLTAVLDCLDQGKDVSAVPGLAWTSNGSVQVNPRGQLIRPLDNLPIPDRSFIDRSQYFGDVLMTGRGCPYSCTYCASRSIWGRTVRLRSVGGVIRELELLRTETERDTNTMRPGRWVVKILDDTFTVNRTRTLALLDEIIARGLNRFEFTGGIRADTLDETVARKLSAANFKRVTLGIESGSPRILSAIRKGQTNEDIKRTLRLLREVGIHSHAFFMIGLPGETPDDIALSKQLILDARPDSIEINMVTPYPGTELFPELVPENPLNIDRWYRWFHQGLATHSDRLGYDLDTAYEDFAAFAKHYNETMAKGNHRP